jgi:diguanylate cyclase (GGDEF)-like protein
VNALANPAQTPANPRVLLISPQNRDSLASQIEDLGWSVVAARKLEGVEQRLADCGAGIVVIDLRGVAEEGLDALVRLRADVRSGQAVIIVIAVSEDEATIDAAVSSGAAHIIQAPVKAFDLKVALRLASRRANAEVDISHTVHLNTSADHRDDLTGLRDSRAVKHWISAQLDGVVKHAVSILLISISRFDTINTAFGVDAGDTVLRSVAHRIEPLVADLHVNMLVARNAGAEFIVCVGDEIAPTRLMLLAEMIAETIERPISTGTEIIRLGCRIGAAPANQFDTESHQILRRASLALAEAKTLETSRIHMVSDGSAAASAASALQSDLRLGLMRAEIETLFQPQVSVIDGKIIGVEALARWRHPIHGELGAVTLFSVAEQSDYIIELSTHVQRNALHSAAQWPEGLAHLRLSINVTAEDIGHPGFVHTFLEMVDESGFPRRRLTVEITETSLMEDLSVAAAILAELRAAGCRVAIDDFGTGYSSLAYLKALPLDYLKIDRGLSVDITGSARDSIVVRGVIDMARSLGLAVIAEGVETEEQLGLLAQEGCNYYQGFLCAEPLHSKDLIQLVEKRV